MDSVHHFLHYFLVVVLLVVYFQNLQFDLLELLRHHHLLNHHLKLDYLL
jgi:hypothetical protein